MLKKFLLAVVVLGLFPLAAEACDRPGKFAERRPVASAVFDVVTAPARLAVRVASVPVRVAVRAGTGTVRAAVTPARVFAGVVRRNR